MNESRERTRGRKTADYTIMREYSGTYSFEEMVARVSKVFMLAWNEDHVGHENVSDVKGRGSDYA